MKLFDNQGNLLIIFNPQKLHSKFQNTIFRKNFLIDANWILKCKILFKFFIKNKKKFIFIISRINLHKYYI